MKYKKETMEDKASCITCGVLVVPARGKIYNFSPATAACLIKTDDGYKYVSGIRPQPHACEKADLEAASHLLYDRLIENKTVIILGDKNNDHVIMEPWKVMCPKCHAPVNTPCLNMSSAKVKEHFTKDYHTERYVAGADRLGYEITWRKQFGKILLKKGAVLA